jgi:Carboxypeptidase regulatory-like domain/TonB-dependent Receptor Plug Domain
MAISVNPALAQLGTATISGNVTDSSGAVVVGASVTALNNAAGFRRQTVSGDQGQYNLPGLTPGSYNLTVEFSGFRRAELTEITLQVDQNARLNVALEIGQVTETVEIAGLAPQIESMNATLGAVVDSQKILSLPLNGRNFLQLARLVPGVTTGTEGGDAGPDGFSANGMRADQNAFQIDGTSNSDPVRNQITFKPSIDSLQEFKIQTTNYSAEFGKGAGAQVNVITKSGTKQFHGGLWEFNRNNKLQARNFFDRDSRSFPCDKTDPNTTSRKACAPQYNQNQFGGNLGGPVLGEKTFFFVNVEEFRQRRGGATVTQVMTPEQRSGDFSRNLLTSTTVADALGRTFRRGQLFDPRSSRQITAANGQLRWVRDPFVGNIIPKSQFDPVAAKMVANTTFMPLPNAPGEFNAAGDNINNYLDSRSNINDSDQVTARIDHQFTPNDTLYGRVFLPGLPPIHSQHVSGLRLANERAKHQHHRQLHQGADTEGDRRVPVWPPGLVRDLAAPRTASPAQTGSAYSPYPAWTSSGRTGIKVRLGSRSQASPAWATAQGPLRTETRPTSRWPCSPSARGGIS